MHSTTKIEPNSVAAQQDHPVRRQPDPAALAKLLEEWMEEDQAEQQETFEFLRRALAHEPQFLILDEATSSVDTETEFRVREALGRMVTGRTSIIVAHRLSTIQRAENILVMHKGRLREGGSHQELLARRGIYWKLYQLQYQEQEVRSQESEVRMRADG